jgi:hypothetical protein
MLINAQECHACSRGIFFRNPCGHGIRSLIDFRNEDERAARFQDSEDFANVTGQVGPSEVCFHCCKEIEHAVRKRQFRNRALPDLDVAGSYPSRHPVGLLH